MKTYIRPMSGWWRRNPYYLWYMLREASCLFITVYALILLVGLYRLQQGKLFFEGWLESLSSPVALGFHAVTLALVLYHSWTWFKIMPRTMPVLRVGGRRVPDTLVIASGVACVFVCSALVLRAAMP